MDAELKKLLVTNPFEICALAFGEVKAIIDGELARVRNSPAPTMEVKSVDKEKRLAFIFNMGLFNLGLKTLGIDLDAARKTGLDNFTSGLLTLVDPRLDDMTSDIIRLVTRFIDCFFVHLVEMHVKTPDADIFLYGGTRCSILLETLLAPSRFHQFRNDLLLEKMVSQLDKFASDHLPFDYFALDPSGDFSRKDKQFFHRDPGSMLAWAFDQGIRMLTHANIMHPKEYNIIMLVLGLLAGFPVYEKTIEIEDTRQTVRQSKMMVESMILRLQILRFELIVSGNLFVELTNAGSILNLDTAFKISHDEEVLRQRHFAETYPRGIGINSPQDIKNFWSKFADWAGDTPLTRGQLQHFQIYVFWLSAPVGSVSASKILQPMRVDHKINTVKDCIHPEDYLLCIFFTSLFCDAKGLIMSYLSLEVIGIRINKLCMAEAREGKVHDYQAAKKQIFDEEIAKRKSGNITRKIMEMAPHCFIPGGVLHRRATILAALCFLDAFLENKEIGSHVESHMIDQPVNRDVLDRTGALVRMGGELAFISHFKTLYVVPTQCPAVFLVNYLGMYCAWKTNSKYNVAMTDFVASIISRKKK